MIPKHCNEVSVRRVSFPLNRSEILGRSVGKKAYTRTGYLILQNDSEWAVTKIEKVEGSDLFREIKEVEIISLPESTDYVEDPTIDLSNPSAMVKKAEQTANRNETVIIKGKFEHISFVHKEKPTPLRIYDVVPPHPPKLKELVEGALGIGRIERPVKLVPSIVNLNTLARTCNTPAIMFPCFSSGIRCGKRTLYLDQAPDLTPMEIDEITLVGCDLSLRTFVSLYGRKPTFVNICPKVELVGGEEQLVSVARCCEIDEGFERVGNVAYVPWGAKMKDVEEAILDLLGLYP